MNSLDRTVLAVDIGGSKFVVAIVGPDGQVHAREHHKWPPVFDAQFVLDAIVQACTRLLEGWDGPAPSAMGATIPGLADPASGTWVEASFSGIKNFPLGPLLTQKLGLPCAVGNDAQACALAEIHFGAGKQAADFLYLTVSNGVGGAVVTNGAVYTGAFGNAGEIGHVCVEPDGRHCKCGKQGCLEAYAAGPGLRKTWLELGGPETIDGQNADAKTIAALAAQGDARAQKVFRLEGEYLGRAIAAAANILNPTLVVLGGGISLAFDAFAPSLRTCVAANTYANESLVLQPTPLGYDGGLLGAAALALAIA